MKIGFVVSPFIETLDQALCNCWWYLKKLLMASHFFTVHLLFCCFFFRFSWALKQCNGLLSVTAFNFLSVLIKHLSLNFIQTEFALFRLNGVPLAWSKVSFWWMMGWVVLFQKVRKENQIILTRVQILFPKSWSLQDLHFPFQRNQSFRKLKVYCSKFSELDKPLRFFSFQTVVFMF